jgi:Integrase zinc binding domain
MNALLSERYWWLYMAQDIAWFVLTCHICQVWKIQKIPIPLIVAMPALLFSKVYMDTMHMPMSSSYKFIVQGHCSLVYWLE